MKRPHLRMLALALLVAGIVGCRSATPSVNYFILRSVEAEVPSTAERETPTIRTVAVQPVELPAPINRTQMVRRSGPNQLEISAFNRWADYPDRLVQQVVENNLEALTPRTRVVHHPWPPGLQPDVTVFIQFRELIGTTDKKMLLTAEWTVIPSNNPTAGQSRRTTLAEPIPGSGFDELAAAHSRVLAALCREVAQALNAGQ